MKERGGRRCPTCGWPLADCRCSAAVAAPAAAVPARVVARLRVERAGRGGKTVTVIDDLPRNPLFLQQLASELKRACGTGGSCGEERVEIQGDQRAAIRALLAAKGWTVRG